MPEAIVDRFEVITIEIRDREGLAIPPAANQLGRHLLIEGGPIRQTSQRIVLRHALLLVQGVLGLPKRKDNDANDTARPLCWDWPGDGPLCYHPIAFLSLWPGWVGMIHQAEVRGDLKGTLLAKDRIPIDDDRIAEAVANQVLGVFVPGAVPAAGDVDRILDAGATGQDLIR
jgi:hypothetical protein